MDTLIETQEERLRLMKEAGITEEPRTESRRRSTTVNAFDAPKGKAEAPTQKTPEPSKFQRFLTGASSFFGGIWGSIKGYFDSWFGKNQIRIRLKNVLRCSDEKPFFSMAAKWAGVP